MANSFYGAIGLTGGGTGALDDINHNDLTDGDGAIVIDAVNDIVYIFTYNSSSSASESSPDVIVPDSNTGNGRWILVDIAANSTDLNSLKLASGATVTEISTDDTLGGSSDTAIVTEGSIKTYVDNQVSPKVTLATIPGYVQRPVFTYSDTDTITIGPGAYHHDGTSEQMVYWNSTLTFDFGSGGTNGDSTNLAADDLYYLYIDDSAVVTAGTNVLTATEFVAVTTEPTWSDTKHGWYNGNDRCIAAFLSDDSSAELDEFYYSVDVLYYESVIEDLTNTDIDEVWTDATLTIPVFSTKGVIEAQLDDYGAAGACRLRIRPKGSSGDGIRVAYTLASDENTVVQVDVITNSNQKIQVVNTTSGAQRIRIATYGYYFGNGI